MKFLFVLFITILSYISFAQSYQPLFAEGKQFSVLHYDEFAPVWLDKHYTHFYSKGDTLINSKTYQQIWCTYSHNIYGYPFDPPPHELVVLVREDTTAGQLFKYFGLPSDSIYGNYYQQEVVFFDFNKQPGDSVLIFQPGGNTTYIQISSIDTLRLSGPNQNDKKIRVWRGNQDSRHQGQFDLSYLPFEDSVLYSEYMLYSMSALKSEFGHDVYFCCAWELDSLGNPQITYTQPGQQCGTNYIGIAEELQRQLFSLEIFPNPATNFVKIVAADKGDFALYDVLGKLVSQSPISAGEQNTLSVANLPAGLYVWVFRTEKGVDKGKLLINH
jgi:hypothetical protein